jgi:ankyrin repeat protein
MTKKLLWLLAIIGNFTFFETVLAMKRSKENREHTQKTQKRLLTQEEQQKLNEELVGIIRANVSEKETIKNLLLWIQRGAYINVQDKNGNTILFWAIEKRSLEVVKFLLQHGINVQIKNKRGSSPLHFAFFMDFVEVIPYLIQHGADINAQNIDGLTPLHIAVCKNQLITARVLLAHGANTAIKNSKGQTPLMLAPENSGIKIYMQLILSYRNVQQSNDDLANFFKSASFIQRKEILTMALMQGAETDLVIFNQLDTEVYSWTQMFEIVLQHKIHDRVNFLVQQGFDINVAINVDDDDGDGEDEFGETLGYTFLHNAVAHQDLSAIEFLMHHGADVNSKSSFLGHTPLYIATNHFLNIAIVRYLLNHGAKVNILAVGNYSPLHNVALHGDLKAAKLLVEYGADINVKDELGNTPSMLLPQDEGNPERLETRSYLDLVKDYRDSQADNRVSNFIKSLNASQQNDILQVNLAQGNTKDLIVFNQMKPKIFSWSHMLDVSEQNNWSNSVLFLISQLFLSTNDLEYILGYSQESTGYKEKLDPLKSIFENAKKNGHKNFGKAMVNYYIELRRSALEKIGRKNHLPTEIIFYITQYHAFSDGMEIIKQ